MDFPKAAEPVPLLSESLRSSGVGLRAPQPADFAFLRFLYADFRAREMAWVSWPPERKRAFLDDQFRLQHHHFTSFFPAADFWIVTRIQPPLASEPIGRLYLDRSTSLWHIIDIGFVAAEREKGLGQSIIAWIQDDATKAEAAGVGLQVATINPRARSLYARMGFSPSAPIENQHEPMIWRVS